MPQNAIQQQSSFVFFGSDEFSVLVLEELKRQGLMPSYIVTTPDTRQGRKMQLTPTPVRVWAKQHEIDHQAPEELNRAVADELSEVGADVFVVASYGKILPKHILDTPPYGTLNIHPSLLPRWRGASPIQSAILYDNGTGVTIMQMDEKMDHGPIVAQRDVPTQDWPPKKVILEAILAKHGAQLLAEVLPQYINGSLTPAPQEHESATFCSKITKDEAHIDLSDEPTWNLRKINAFHEWPKPYFFHQREKGPMRVIITDARMSDDDDLEIRSVIPEGKKEMSYDEFVRGFGEPA